jgi:hypothetical protein
VAAVLAVSPAATSPVGRSRDAARSDDERRRFIYAQEQRIHRGQPLRLAK